MRSAAVLVLFVSESNTCRSVLAEALFKEMLSHTPLAHLLTVRSCALSSHSLWEPPHVATLAVARELGLTLPANCRSTPYDFLSGDLVLFMDRFDRETLQLQSGLCELQEHRLRRLGDCAPPQPRRMRSGEIEDPLYHLPPASSRAHSEAAAKAVWAATRHIRAGCRGLLTELLRLAIEAGVLSQLPCKEEEEEGCEDGYPPTLEVAAVQRTGSSATTALAAALEAELMRPAPPGQAQHRPLALAPEMARPWTAARAARSVWVVEGGQMFTLRRARRKHIRARAHAHSGRDEDPGREPAELHRPVEENSDSDSDSDSDDPRRPSVAVRYLPPESHKPHGYWNSLEHVCSELEAWRKAHGAGGTGMPTLSALRRSGFYSLEKAVVQHGGLHAVAAALGLRCARGNYESWDAVAAGLKAVALHTGVPAGVMPARKAFLTAGRGDLYSCLVRYGGVAAVAHRAGLLYRKGPAGRCYRAPQLQTLAQARIALEAMAAEGHVSPGCVPARRQFAAANQLPLYNRLSCIAGGMPALAQMLGMRFEGRVLRRSSDRAVTTTMAEEEMLKQLRAFQLAASSDGAPPRMPSKRSLLAAGRRDLADGVTALGAAQVAARLGWTAERRGRRRTAAQMTAEPQLAARPAFRAASSSRGSVDAWLEEEENAAAPP